MFLWPPGIGGPLSLYQLQKLLFDVKASDELREKFLGGQEAQVASRYDLTAEERRLLTTQDPLDLYRYGVNPVLVLFYGYLLKMNARERVAPHGGY